jgi:SNF2 family DNA or RNA helicase
MERILGAEAATTQSAPYLPALMRAADRGGLRLHESVREMLEREQLLRRHAKILKTLEDVQPVFKLEARAFAHQRTAFHFIREMHRRGVHHILEADDTGVGKTLVFLLWSHLYIRSTRTLIITKNIAKDQWADAIHDFLGKQRVTIVDGTMQEQREQILRTTQGFVIGHWESLGTEVSSAYLKRPWGCIGLDEAHQIGNRDARRSHTAFRLRADARMAMTAHPYSNHPGELFSILRFLYPDRYRSYWRFFHMHVRAVPKAFGGFEIQGPRRPKLLRWELAPFTLQRTKPEVYKNLPPITRMRRTVSLTTTGAREYERLRKQVFAELDGLDGETKLLPIINDLVRVTRLRQYLIDPGLVGAREPSVKYPAILDIMDEVGEPLVVFTSFKQAALRLDTFLRKKQRKLRTAHVNGDVSRVKRGAAKKNFLAGNLDVLLVVTEAGQEALNLGGYGYVAHLDLPWTPRALEQSEGRVDRPEEGTGRLVPTTAFRVIVKNSYEEKLEQRLNRKHRGFTQVFTARTLRELFE